ncbi:MAG: adenine phosphoribosyltransferase [Candidatus Marinimicrobia bacterium]|nr:adenine phosphoribosyltransferase [Candidatus Neomarinimicrobiota bacterium]
MDLKQHIRQVPDFPKAGINFFDISTLIGHAKAWRTTIERMTDMVKPWQPDVLAAVDARGFLVASPLALSLNCGMLMVRKSGKLPGKVKSHSYRLEYATDTLEIQHDAVKSGQRVIVLDDLLATGGTLSAATTLLQDSGANVVGAACLIELAFLKGRDRLEVPFAALLSYDNE